jgi:hypothetical protein
VQRSPGPDCGSSSIQVAHNAFVPCALTNDGDNQPSVMDHQCLQHRPRSRGAANRGGLPTGSILYTHPVPWAQPPMTL